MKSNMNSGNYLVEITTRQLLILGSDYSWPNYTCWLNGSVNGCDKITYPRLRLQLAKLYLLTEQIS
jgi:hypothetical protein